MPNTGFKMKFKGLHISTGRRVYSQVVGFRRYHTTCIADTQNFVIFEKLLELPGYQADQQDNNYGFD